MLNILTEIEVPPEAMRF